MNLIIKNLIFGYKKRQNVITDASAVFGAGVHLLLGPNGAGKTTLLRLMAGLLIPREGSCLIEGESTSCHMPYTTKNIFLLGDDTVFPLDTINQMAARHAPFYPNFSRSMLEDALKAFGMNGDEPIRDLSLGNRHKAHVAYSLALGTEILLLDEPANGLDMTSKKELASLIGKAMVQDEDRCIIIATHTVQEMRNLFDSVTVISNGRITLNAYISSIVEKVAFISDTHPHADALYYEPSVDGACQAVPNDGTKETSVDYNILYNIAIGNNARLLNDLLND